MLVDGATFASLAFAFFYLWTVTPSGWPPADIGLVALDLSLVAAAGWMLTSIAIEAANYALQKNGAASGFTLTALASLLGGCAALFLQFRALERIGAPPDEHAYAAVMYTLLALQALHVVLLVLMIGYTLVRATAGKLDSVRRTTFDNTRLMLHYTAAQGVLGVLIMNAPRLSM
jgi:cytochrome c oxidase subunit I+III